MGQERVRNIFTPLRVVLDARKLGDGGIGVYIENVIRGLDLHLGNTAEVLAIVSDEAAAKLPQVSNNLRLIPIQDGAAKYSVDEMLLMPVRLKEFLRNADLFHAPHYTLPYGLGIPSVVTIHDIIHITKPDTILHRALGKLLIGSAVKRADTVLTVSKASAEEIERVFGRREIEVIYNALREDFYGQDFYDQNSDNVVGTYSASRTTTSRASELCFLHPTLQAEQEFLLFVADNRPHKGFRPLYQAWLRLRTQFPQLGLVVVGTGFESLAKEANVITLPKLHASELRELYKLAKLVVVPSYEEGFGFIPLEAIASGASVVSRDLACIREVCGNLPQYFQSDAELETVISQMLATPKPFDGSRASALVDRFRLREFGRQLAELYCRTCGLVIEQDRQSSDVRSFSAAECPVTEAIGQ